MNYQSIRHKTQYIDRSLLRAIVEELETFYNQSLSKSRLHQIYPAAIHSFHFLEILYPLLRHRTYIGCHSFQAYLANHLRNLSGYDMDQCEEICKSFTLKVIQIDHSYHYLQNDILFFQYLFTQTVLSRSSVSLEINFGLGEALIQHLTKSLQDPESLSESEEVLSTLIHQAKAFVSECKNKPWQPSIYFLHECLTKKSIELSSTQCETILLGLFKLGSATSEKSRNTFNTSIESIASSPEIAAKVLKELETNNIIYFYKGTAIRLAEMGQFLTASLLNTDSRIPFDIKSILKLNPAWQTHYIETHHNIQQLHKLIQAQPGLSPEGLLAISKRLINSIPAKELINCLKPYLQSGISFELRSKACEALGLLHKESQAIELLIGAAKEQALPVKNTAFTQLLIHNQIHRAENIPRSVEWIPL